MGETDGQEGRQRGKIADTLLVLRMLLQVTVLCVDGVGVGVGVNGGGSGGGGGDVGGGCRGW